MTASHTEAAVAQRFADWFNNQSPADRTRSHAVTFAEVLDMWQATGSATDSDRNVITMLTAKGVLQALPDGTIRNHLDSR